MGVGLHRLQFGERHSRQAGVDMEGQGLRLAGLAVSQPSELFAVAEQEFNLEAGYIVAVEFYWIESEVGAKQNRSASGVAVGHDHHPQTATQAGGVDP